MKVAPYAEDFVAFCFDRKILIRPLKAYGLDAYVRVSIPDERGTAYLIETCQEWEKGQRS